MWLRNKVTGLVWDVDGKLSERLANDPDYETVDDPAGTDEVPPVIEPAVTLPPAEPVKTDDPTPAEKPPKAKEAK